MATIGETGWPLFETALRRRASSAPDEKAIGAADYRGERRRVDAGHPPTKSRAWVIVADCPNKARSRLFVRATRIGGADGDTLSTLAAPGYIRAEIAMTAALSREARSRRPARCSACRRSKARQIRSDFVRRLVVPPAARNGD
jgi:hypothetical protein